MIVPSDQTRPQVLDTRAVIWKLQMDGSATEERGCYVSHFYT